MKRKTQTIRRITLAMLIAIVGLYVGTYAWASVSYVQPNDAVTMHKVDTAIPEAVADKDKARAPEPTSLALFGTGFFGMVMSFIQRTYRAAKRTFDVVSVILGLVVLSPLLLLAAVLVKATSKGPIIYSQTRVGKDGQLFEIFKFRTMRVDAEKDSGPVWAKTNDNRLTPVGGFLRKTHVDELPQLINILKGEMSLIGPRPERPVFVEDFKEKITDYERRLDVKPGLTGLAQVFHRYDETINDVRKKVKYDLLYIKKVCFLSDLRILLRTVRVVITGEGAK